MDNPGNLYGKASPENFPNETDYRNPVIAVAMKTLGYVNQFGRGVEMVQEELEANKNGLPEFKFDDITTFKAIVMNADPKTDGAENGADGAENGADGAENGAENGADGAENGAENGADTLTAKEKNIIFLIK